MGKHHRKLLNNLEQLRKESGLTQQELSESADVSRKSINAIENGIYMFVYQANQSFSIWNNVIPKIDEEVLKILE